MSKPAHILVVEDDRSLARLVQRGLLREGYTVEVVHDGAEAMIRLAHGGLDLVMTDVHLPGANGLRVLSASKQFFPRVPVLLVTGEPRPHITSAAIDAGVDGYVLKPLNQQNLLKRIAQTVQRSRDAAPKGKTVLAIGAHPDDVEIGVGGTLWQHFSAGDDIHILCLSWGSNGGMAETRQREAEDAAGKIRATLHSGGLPDTRFALPDTLSAIERVVQAVSPNIVYTHAFQDLHQDHRMTHEATLIGCRAIPTLFAYQSPSTTVAFQPTRFQDIERYMEQKLDLVGSHASQSGCRSYLEPDLLRSTARYWGRFAQRTFVEPLVVLRQAESA